MEQTLAILRTNNYDENFEMVTVIKNPISEKNHLALIEKNDKKQYMTGGILVKYHPTTKVILEKMSFKEQYQWLSSLKDDCTVINHDIVI